MRKVKIFSGSSHPQLAASICERLGVQPAKCELGFFSNGETRVDILTSIRDHDVFIIQSGSKNINDSIVELLIMVSACKGSSAKSITAIIPYFPYSRQSKKKSHRGSITARMLASLLGIAGVQHVITVDLHASPIQGFFSTPVDNLYAEPLIARWIRTNVPEWQEAVVVSKNPGGSKRVTSLADRLKLNFAVITTDRRRENWGGSVMGDSGFLSTLPDRALPGPTSAISLKKDKVKAAELRKQPKLPLRPQSQVTSAPRSSSSPQRQSTGSPAINPPVPSIPDDMESSSSARARLQRTTTVTDLRTAEVQDSKDEYTDERARDVTTGRLIQGHIVDDDYPSPMLSTTSSLPTNFSGDSIGPPHFEDRDPMASSFVSTTSFRTADAMSGGEKHESRDYSEGEGEEEGENLENPALEHTITLVGNVQEKTVLIIDDLIDRCDTWVAAAETAVMRGRAQKVYCIATHGLFGGQSLEIMEKCRYIDYIIVTNTFPITLERIQASKKLVILNMSGMLAEAIRRTHFGESIQQIYQYYDD